MSAWCCGEPFAPPPSTLLSPPPPAHFFVFLARPLLARMRACAQADYEAMLHAAISAHSGGGFSRKRKTAREMGHVVSHTALDEIRKPLGGQWILLVVQWDDNVAGVVSLPGLGWGESRPCFCGKCLRFLAPTFPPLLLVCSSVQLGAVSRQDKGWGLGLHQRWEPFPG